MKAFPRRMSCSGQKPNTTMGRPGPVLPFWSVSPSLFFSDMPQLAFAIYPHVFFDLQFFAFELPCKTGSQPSPPDLSLTRLSRRQAITCPSTATTAAACLEGTLLKTDGLSLTISPVYPGRGTEVVQARGQEMVYTDVCRSPEKHVVFIINIPPCRQRGTV